jgi:diguanylate cyclase (GGDEF)-like protein
MTNSTAEESGSILIVDDVPDNLNLLNHLLSQEGYRVRVAPGGVLALSSVKANPPDLILLDIRMPDMDGFAVCRALKEDETTRHIPVIFLTALNSSEDEGQGLELGAVDYITKPFNPRLAVARVRNHMMFVRQRKLLERWAMLDGLTEIPNRRRFDEAVAEECKRAQRTGGLLSLAILDLDFFKNFNDNLGHLAGDRALVQVARALTGCFHRPSDLVARYGGEEFVMLMPETDAQGAIKLAESARGAVAGLQLRIGEEPNSALLTASIGGATRRIERQCNPESLLDLADRRLYESKTHGKNRVTWDAPPVPEGGTDDE